LITPTAAKPIANLKPFDVLHTFMKYKFIDYRIEVADLDHPRVRAMSNQELFKFINIFINNNSFVDVTNL